MCTYFVQLIGYLMVNKDAYQFVIILSVTRLNTLNHRHFTYSFNVY